MPAMLLEAGLTIVCDGDSETLVVHSLPAVVGRGEGADVRIEDPWVSRFHCILNEIDGRTLVVRDLGAKNGIFVNGLRTSDSLLLPGDRLTIRRTEITVQYHRRPKTGGTLSPCEELATMAGNGDAQANRHELYTSVELGGGDASTLRDNSSEALAGTT